MTYLEKVNGIAISYDIVAKTLTTLKALPYETTTSMHTYFIKKNNEVESLTGYEIGRHSNMH